MPPLRVRYRELRSALEALRLETDKQSGGRLKLAGEIRKDVEVSGFFVGESLILKMEYVQLPIQEMATKIGGMRKTVSMRMSFYLYPQLIMPDFP